MFIDILYKYVYNNTKNNTNGNSVNSQGAFFLDELMRCLSAHLRGTLVNALFFIRLSEFQVLFSAAMKFRF